MTICPKCKTDVVFQAVYNKSLHADIVLAFRGGIPYLKKEGFSDDDWNYDCAECPGCNSILSDDEILKLLLKTKNSER
jgi:hypothetical protein